MVESFEIPQDEVGKWAGICAAVFSLFQAVMGIPWGMFSDKYGRKPAILLGLASTMLTSLLWGFSKNLPMAIVARALAGAGNGNVGIIRTTVAEMVPFKELQPRAFSIMPLVWNIGSIFGPSIGGTLANPLNVKPGERRENSSMFEVFPYALPNIVSACFFAISITTGFFFLQETLEGLEGRRDYGLIIGDKVTSLFKRYFTKLEVTLHIRSKRAHDDVDSETDPLLKHKHSDEEDSVRHETEPKIASPTWREVLNKQAVINLAVYTLLALHGTAFDQLVPVLLQREPIESPGSTLRRPPLKFAGGFGLSRFQIGLMSTSYGVVGIVIQFFVFPPLARKYGVLLWLKIVACGFPVLYFVTPFTTLLPTAKLQIGCMFTVMLLKCLCGVFAFPCSTILLTNSASSLRILGTLNGVATTVSAIGRAAGPAMAGAVFTAGVKKGYLIAPWWFLSALAILAAIPVFCLVESEGFGGDDEVSDVEDELEDDEQQQGQDLATAAAEGQAEAMGKPPVLPFSTSVETSEDEEHEEHAYGGLAPLSRTDTQVSSAMLSEDESEAAGPANRTRSRRASGIERSATENTHIQPSPSRRSSRRVTRKVSGPIGGQGISRRFSSNLGQSYGSAGSYQ